VKGINARATLISLFLVLAGVTQGQAEDYYIYQTPNGAVVITNKEPPPGSKITKRISFSDAPDNEAPQNQPTDKPQPNGPTERSPKPSKTK
jgi:CRISPR/Cas system-associated protein Csm6